MQISTANIKQLDKAWVSLYLNEYMPIAYNHIIQQEMFNREDGQELLEGPVQFVHQYVDMPNYKLEINGAPAKVRYPFVYFYCNPMT